MRLRILARRYNSGWKNEMPSVSDIRWESEYGDGSVVSRPGLPKKTIGASIEEQDKYLRGKEKLNDEPITRSNRFRENQTLEEEFRKKNSSNDSPLTRYTDDLITERIISSKQPPQGYSSIISQETIERSADITKAGVQAVFKSMEGIDLSESSEIISVKNPPALIVPNTRGMFRDSARTKLSDQVADYKDSQEWFHEKLKTIVLVTNSNSHGAEYAEALPEANFIIVSETNTSFFRIVSNGCSQSDGFAPENMKFVKADVAFYFQNIVPDESVDEVHFIHPNTCSSYDQSHKRVPTTELFQLIHQKLKVGGSVRLLTKSTSFFDWVFFEARYCHCEFKKREVDDSQLSTLMLEAQKETHLSIPTDWSVSQKSSLQRTFISEWEKVGPTPELIYDLNQKYSYRRMNHSALGGPLKRQSWR